MKFTVELDEKEVEDHTFNYSRLMEQLHVQLPKKEKKFKFLIGYVDLDDPLVKVGSLVTIPFGKEVKIEGIKKVYGLTKEKLVDFAFWIEDRYSVLLPKTGEMEKAITVYLSEQEDKS